MMLAGLVHMENTTLLAFLDDLSGVLAARMAVQNKKHHPIR